MRLFLLFILLATNLSISFAQNVGIGTNNPDASAKLEVKSNNSHSMVLPTHMTYVERSAFQDPATGFISYTVHSKIGEWQENIDLDWFDINGTIASDPLPPVDTIIPSITIGTQIWSSKNLDVARYRNGDPIPQVLDSTQWANLTTGAWCWFKNDSITYAATYGRLYNWYAVNDPRGLAPKGWHIPTDAEWNKLVANIDPGADTICSGCFQSSIVGGAMKNTNGWNSPNTGATNSSGFSGLPGGCRNYNSIYVNLGFNGFWWSATTYNSAYAWGRKLINDKSKVLRLNYGKTFGFSVRIVKD